MSDVWSDFDTVRHSVKHNTVDRLKQFLIGFHDECGVILSKSGKKQDIIDRIVAQLDNWKINANADKWSKARAVINMVKLTGHYTATPVAPVAPAAPNQALYSTTNPLAPAGYPTATGSTTVGRYDPYAPPRKPTASTSALPPAPPAPKAGLRFKPSPFMQFDSHISGVVECPESVSAQDRRSANIQFTLTADQLAKLKSITRKYELRLFCTSSAFYTPNGFRTSGLCPIEFPPTCEVRVNSVALVANLKGLKKKPGTAPPADLGKLVRATVSHQNRVEMVYVNSQQPVTPKKFYIVVSLVEVTEVPPIVNKLKAEKFRSSVMIRNQMNASLREDDDIVAGPAKMSLKCPLSFMRITTPCRSSSCVHSQCFDATSWFSVMQQTTTWLCPVCERTLDFNDLLIDGYFDEILKACPEDVEDVIVESNGDWHTSDNKFASVEWRALHPIGAPPPPKPVAQKPASQGPSNGKAKQQEIFVIDSDDDDEDEGRVKRELSPSFISGSSSTVSVQQQPQQPLKKVVEEVIDLTLDSDDDEPPPPKRAEKRKASTPEEPQPEWKRARTVSTGIGPPQAYPGSGSATGGSNVLNPLLNREPRPHSSMSASRTLPALGNGVPPPQPGAVPMAQLMQMGISGNPNTLGGRYVPAPAPPYYGAGVERERYPYSHAAAPGPGTWR